METNRCPSCGALLENSEEEVVTCSYCGTKVIIDKTRTKKQILKKENKKNTKIIIFVVLVVVIATILSLFLLSKKENKVDNVEEINQEAYDLGPQTTNTILDLKELKIGDSLLFGNYEQDNNLDNGEEKIEWVIIRRDDKSCLLISKYVLDHVAYNNDFEFTNWEDSSIREWLSQYFYNHSFNEEEKQYIEEVENDIEYASNGITKDKVFLLSVSEADEYFDGDEDRIGLATDYAIARGVQAYENRSCWWWLRSVCEDNEYAMNVRSAGNLRYGADCAVNSDGYGIRPVVLVAYEKEVKEKTKVKDANNNPNNSFTIEILDEKMGVYDSYKDSRKWVDAIYQGETYTCEETYYDGTYYWYKIGKDRWIKDPNGTRIKSPLSSNSNGTSIDKKQTLINKINNMSEYVSFAFRLELLDDCIADGVYDDYLGYSKGTVNGVTFWSDLSCDFVDSIISLDVDDSNRIIIIDIKYNSKVSSKFLLKDTIHNFNISIKDGDYSKIIYHQDSNIEEPFYNAIMTISEYDYHLNDYYSSVIEDALYSFPKEIYPDYTIIINGSPVNY